MPMPPPTSSSGSEAAAALVSGGWTRAMPVERPKTPTATATAPAPAAKVETKSSERSIAARPAVMGAFAPTLSESRPLRGERRAYATAPGVRARPAAPADSPFSPIRSSGISTSAERLASIAKKPTRTART